MKRFKIVNICLAACLALLTIISPANLLKVQADEVIATVQGTILSGTTSEILVLSTKEGKMEIKMDSGTDFSSSKVLLPDWNVSVSVSHGSDGYLHAVKITGTTQVLGVSLDTATTATVTGTIGEKTKDDILYLKTAQGEMQIKLDTTTNMSGCSVLVAGKNYTVTCARGSDAYMHAISISDTMSATPSKNLTGPSVTGTVAGSTKESLLYLSTKDGEMQFKIDNDADTNSGMILTTGSKLTVYYSHGSDGYLHAIGIVGVKDSAKSVEIDTANTAIVSGTVGSKSNENLLFLETDQGTMELRLDAVSSLINCKVLVSGKKVSVSCARGSDAYMHALTITGS